MQRMYTVPAQCETEVRTHPYVCNSLYFVYFLF